MQEHHGGRAFLHRPGGVPFWKRVRRKGIVHAREDITATGNIRHVQGSGMREFNKING